MNYSRRGAHQQMSQINVVPYIDVMLVLLIIFMITAPLMNPGQIDLPSVGKSLAPAVAPLEVIIRRNGDMSLRDHSRGGVEFPVSSDELVAQLQRSMKRNPDQPVVISADRNVRYEDVVKVMDILQQQHIRKIGLLTKIR